MLQSRGFKLAIITEFIIEVLQVDLLALSWWLAAAHIQTTAKGAETNQDYEHKNGHTSGKRQIAELGEKATLGLQKQKTRPHRSETEKNVCSHQVVTMATGMTCAKSATVAP